MNHMLPEGLHPQPEGYTREELLLAMQQRRVLQARAVLCDERHALHVPLGCCEGVIERAEAKKAVAIPSGIAAYHSSCFPCNVRSASRRAESDGCSFPPYCVGA